tara:strand:+ start:269 stop:865 length:597 start_codon:yes stop_codon:yes gene_type:complete
MSRSKKSRKPGIGSSGEVKTDKKQPAVIVNKKPKKQTGNKPGNRQQEAFNSVDNNTTKARRLDPRIGSKKPILLTPIKDSNIQNTKQRPAKNKPKTSIIDTIVGSEPIASTTALTEELHAIEDDILLQSILAKQENNVELSERNVDYFNEKMSRYQVLQNALGLADKDDLANEQSSVKDDDDDSLWDKLDNNNLSSFD